MTLAKKLKKIYRKEDWKNIFLNGYKESGCTQHLEQTVNVPLYNEHEDEILDYFEDNYTGKEPLIEKIIKIAAGDIVVVKFLAVIYYIELFACEVVGIPYSGEISPRKERKALREMGIFDYKGNMVPPPPDFERKKGSAHNTDFKIYKI